MRQHVVVYHGIGNAGKSAFAYQIALMRTIFDDARWAVFSPENHPPTYFYDDLIHMYLGKPSNRRAHNRATEDEYNQGMAFLADKFYYVYPNSENPTPEYIFKVFTHLIKTKKIDGVIIDPYNQMTNELDATGREDRYISQFLGKCKRFAIQHNIYFWIIAHPKGGLKRVKNSQDYDRPNVYDLAGGGMWISKCDDILCVHRKYFYSDPQDTTVEITSQKIKKQKLCGIPGTVEFSFDRQANRFEFAGYNPMSHKTALEEAGITSNDQDAPF
jgi:twinkle protein